MRRYKQIGIISILIILSIFNVSCSNSSEGISQDKANEKMLSIAKNIAKDLNDENLTKKEDLYKKVENIKINDTGYGFLLNQDYQFIVHASYKNNEYLGDIAGGIFASPIETLNNNNHAIFTYVFNNNKRMMVFVRLENGDILGVITDYEEIEI